MRYPGFSRTFGIGVVTASGATIELPKELTGQVAASTKPHIVLAEALTKAIGVLRGKRSEFDVLMILLPPDWARGFESDDGEFDLHDYLKAATASFGIPTQVVREDSALRYFCRASVMWRLSIALYCKAGGIPWKLSQPEDSTAYVGLSYALRSADIKANRFVTCCSQIFDAQGAGLEFITYDTDVVRVDRDNPYLSRDDMRRVMARSLRLYQERHFGVSPVRVVVHKSTAFKGDEIDGCFDALNVADVELVWVQQDVPWRGIKIVDKAQPDAYPCDRGSCLQLGDRDVLLWAQGNSLQVTGGRNYFKEGKGIAQPLLLTKFTGHSTVERTCASVLGLTKMNWNNDAHYDSLPVTMSYAQVLARTVKRMPELKPTPYQFRFFM